MGEVKNAREKGMKEGAGEGKLGGGTLQGKLR